MTEQIQSHPTDFRVEKHFGPFFASCMLPQDALDAMLKMSDEILSDKYMKRINIEFFVIAKFFQNNTYINIKQCIEINILSGS